jgi:predicted anti-sigma-YlaC factor YlaD
MEDFKPEDGKAPAQREPGRLAPERAATAKLLTAILFGTVVAGCSIDRVAVNILGDKLAGGDVYASDEDPELIREALPFGLKTFESLLQVSPEHPGLLLSTARGFSAYAYLLADEAHEVEERDLAQARKLRRRAGNLFLRGRDYALRGLAARHEGLVEALQENHATALGETTQDDVPLLYLAGASWAGALSTRTGDMALLADLPVGAALVARSMELDETFDRGAAHEFFLSYEASRPGGSDEKAREHYRRALELSGGARASLHLALAESIAVKNQDLAQFHDLLDLALAVDPDGVPELRLINNIAQQRARRLKSRESDLFLLAQLKE